MLTVMLRATCLCAAAVLAAGCLSTTHKIPRSELMRLSQSPPETRGERVRVIQGFSGDDQPPEAPRVHGGVRVSVYAGGSTGRPARRAKRLPAKDLAEDSKFWLVVAAVAAVGLAATEGARFDGWAKMHPMHPVHIYGPYGEYTWVPLAHLDPETAAWASKAFVRETEGPWQRLERAPLNRVGLTYSLLLGSAQIPSVVDQNTAGEDAVQPGFLGHIQLGVFPTQTLGILLDFGMGWRNNSNQQTVFEARNALELQLFLAQAGKLHAGLYGQLGVALRAEDVNSGVSAESRTFMTGAGAQLQLELTTRLTLTGRFGYLRILGEDTAEATVGVSIY